MWNLASLENYLAVFFKVQKKKLLNTFKNNVPKICACFDLKSTSLVLMQLRFVKGLFSQL